MENSKNPILHEVRDFYRDLACEVLEAYTFGKWAGLKSVLVAILIGVIFAVAVVFIIGWNFVCALVHVLASVPGRVRATYRDFLHRHFDNIGLVGGFAVVLATSYGLYLYDSNTPTLSLATVQVLFSAPLLLFMEVHTTIWCYKHLLPEQFRQLLGQLGEKLNESVLPPLDELVTVPYFPTTTEALAVAKFKLYYHVLKFGIRCTRFVLYGIPFYLLFKAMEFNINLVLNMQPH